MGARQSGDALLRFADLTTDGPLIEAARAAAMQLLKERPDAARGQVDRWLASREEFVKA
jgi:ATP-dependent DNA helicase RecG